MDLLCIATYYSCHKYGKLARCILHARCLQHIAVLQYRCGYYLTGRAKICSSSLKATRRLIALGFHKEKEVCQHSHSSVPVLVHTIQAIHCNILPYAIHRYVEVSVLNCVALRRIAILLLIDILGQLYNSPSEHS